MRFNLITNMNGVGLQQDAEMLAQELGHRGHEVSILQFDRPQVHLADVNIFLEVVVEQMLRLAPQNCLVPNPEWYYRNWPTAPFRWFLTKTQDASQRFVPLVNGKCRYIGWRARDLYRSDVKRERKFLHVAGKSQFKNTDAVIKGCSLAGVPLTVVSQATGRVSDEAMAELFNSHTFFLCPSAYEGFGMALHEALGCGAVVMTTDAAPMNEIMPSILIRSSASQAHNLGILHAVEHQAVAEAVHQVMALTDGELSEWRLTARMSYEREVKNFSHALDVILGELCQ